MKKSAFFLLMALMCQTMTAATDLEDQPLLNTRVETGNVEGVLEGSLSALDIGRIAQFGLKGKQPQVLAFYF